MTVSFYQFNTTLTPTDNQMDSRAFAYGDGFFSTLGVKDKKILWRPLHKERLTTGAKRFELVFDTTAVLDSLTHLANDISQGIIKVIITRPSQMVRGYGFTSQQAQIFIKTMPSNLYQSVEWIDNFPIWHTGQATCLNERLGLRSPRFSGIKLISSHEQIFAHKELLNKQYHNPNLTEGLVKNTQNLWISGTTSNVFYQLHQSWYTPPIEHSGVKGVARTALLSKHAINERPLTDDDLPYLTGLFFCNAVRGIFPINGLWFNHTNQPLQAHAFRELF